MARAAPARDDRRMTPSRISRPATICAALMCCAALVPVLGINRIVVTDGHVGASARSAPVATAFKSETFPLERGA
jgi:hypothetical protein